MGNAEGLITSSRGGMLKQHLTQPATWPKGVSREGFTVESVEQGRDRSAVGRALVLVICIYTL